MEISISETAINHLNKILLEKYTVDFSKYALSSYVRRVERYLSLQNLKSIEDLIIAFDKDNTLVADYIEEITVNTTEMFRDPEFWLVIRNEILPKIAQNDSIRIWHAGCSSGQEVFSMLILLTELGLSHRAKIVATDLSNEILKKAKAGAISKKEWLINQDNYTKSGGTRVFENYFNVKEKEHLFNSELLKNINFKKHNLVVDNAFSKFDLILCRNVMIYFNKELQDNVYQTFAGSLFKDAYLAIGMKETMNYSPAFKLFKEVRGDVRIYQLTHQL
jgi:chemotaxis protein methyltransferase CheR